MKKKVIFLDFDGVMETVFQLPLEDATKVKYDKYGPMFDDECVNNLRLTVINIEYLSTNVITIGEKKKQSSL